MNTVIIGGGVIGLSIARELKKRGVDRIRIVDKGSLGREASWAAAGILAPQVEADFRNDFFKLCYESNRIYDTFAEELSAETGIDIELDRRGVLDVGFNDQDAAEFDRRFKWQSAAGLKVERVTLDDIRGLEPSVSPDCTCGLLFPDDGQVENRKLVEALASFARTNGIKIEEGVEAHRILLNGDRVRGIETDRGIYHAELVVLATGAWTSFIQLGETAVPVDVKPVRGQMICYKIPTMNFEHVIYSRRGYLVQRADGRLLAGATVEDVGFDKSTTNKGIAALKNIAAEIAPALMTEDVVEKWAGLRPFAKGGVPVIGAAPNVDGLFIATGHFRNGILLAPITARMIADAVTGARHDRPSTFGVGLS